LHGGELDVLGAAEDQLGRLDLVERRVPDVKVDGVRVPVVRREGEGRDAREGRVPKVRRLNRVDPEAWTEERVAHEGRATAEAGHVRVARRVGDRDARGGSLFAEHAGGASGWRRSGAPAT